MKRLFLVLALLTLVGCEKADKLLGIEVGDPKPAPQFFVVACCQDVVGGVASYPSFLPSSHISLCETAKKAAGGMIGQDTYLATQSDCGNQEARFSKSYKIGDEFYVGKGY